MALPFQHVSLHATTFFTLTALTCAAQAAVLGITVSLAIITPHATHAVRQLTIGAAALELCALLSTATASMLYLQRVSRRVLSICCGSMMIVVLPALIVTIYALVRIRSGISASTRPEPLRSIDIGGMATWAVMSVFLILFYIFILWPERHSTRRYDHEAMGRSEVKVHSIKPSHGGVIRMAMLSVSAPPTAGTKSKPTASVAGGDPVRPPSFRTSMQQAIKPVTSRTRLIRTYSLGSRESRSVRSSHEERRENDFENWDTSGVEQSIDPLFTMRVSSRPTGRPRLETIPGSRPVSPAKALDGPFSATTQQLYAETTPLPPSPSPSAQRPRRPITFHSTAGSPPTTRQPNRSRDGPQAHIHPLFRTQSPSGIPLVASSGTSITASPYAGQVVQLGELTFSTSAAAATAAPRRLRSAHSTISSRRDSGTLTPVKVEARSRSASGRSATAPASGGVVMVVEGTMDEQQDG